MGHYCTVPSPQTIKRRRSIAPAQVLANARRATRGVKIGRPLSYTPELCDRAIALGHKGKHWAAIAREFGISRKTLYEWQREYSAFSDALDRARAASQAWWEDKVQQKLGAKHFQANAARLVMSGQFKEDYAERPQATAGEMVEFLAAVIDSAGERKPKAIPEPGDQAKAVEPLDVVTGRPNRDR